MLCLQAAQDAAAAELAELRSTAAAGQAASAAEAAACKSADDAAFLVEHAELARQVGTRQHVLELSGLVWRLTGCFAASTNKVTCVMETHCNSGMQQVEIC